MNKSSLKNAFLNDPNQRRNAFDMRTLYDLSEDLLGENVFHNISDTDQEKIEEMLGKLLTKMAANSDQYANNFEESAEAEDIVNNFAESDLGDQEFQQDLQEIADRPEQEPVKSPDEIPDTDENNKKNQDNTPKQKEQEPQSAEISPGKTKPQISGKTANIDQGAGKPKLQNDNNEPTATQPDNFQPFTEQSPNQDDDQNNGQNNSQQNTNEEEQPGEQDDENQGYEENQQEDEEENEQERIKNEDFENKKNEIYDKVEEECSPLESQKKLINKKLKPLEKQKMMLEIAKYTSVAALWLVIIIIGLLALIFLITVIGAPVAGVLSTAMRAVYTAKNQTKKALQTKIDALKKQIKPLKEKITKIDKEIQKKHEAGNKAVDNLKKQMRIQT